MNNRASTQILGAIVGATAGYSRHGSRDFRRLEFYEPIPTQMSAQEGLDAWVIWAQHLRDLKPPEALGQTRGDCLQLRSIEASFGDTNIKAGIYPPFSGNFRHPLPYSARVWTRSLYWGIVCPAHIAANFAYWDVECDQGSDNAVLAATLAAALSSAGPVDWLRKMIGLVERVTSAKQILRLVAALTTEGYSPEDIYRRVQGAVESQDPYDATLNLGFLAMSVLAGQGDFGKSVCVAAGCGGASEATAAYVGALTAGWKEQVPAEWLEPLGEGFVGSAVLLRGEPPTRIDDFIHACLDGLPLPISPERPAAKQPTVALSAEDATTGYVTEFSPVETVVPEEVPEPMQPVVIPAINSGSCAYSLENILVTVTYDDLPVAQPERTIRCLVTIEAKIEDVVLNPVVHTPPDWNIAHRLVSCRISKGSKQTFPLVVQAGESEGPALVQFGERFIPIVAMRTQDWYLTGPFANFDGFGFEKPLRCEDILRQSEVFAGRGELATKWKRKTFAGVTFDLEPYFMEGAGILCLHGKLEFPSGGRFKIVVSGSPGVMVKVDQRILVKYMDTHVPIRRPMKPYVAEFETGGVSEVTIRVARHLDPASPLTIYFLNEEGRVVMPVRTLAMDP